MIGSIPDLPGSLRFPNYSRCHLVVLTEVGLITEKTGSHSDKVTNQPQLILPEITMKTKLVMKHILTKLSNEVFLPTEI
jgi:hypothetical protein